MSKTYQEMPHEELKGFLSEHMCDCGAPENAAASLLRLLEQYSDENRDGEPAYLALPRWIPDDGAMFLLLYWIDHLGLIEHGGGILASWLTKRGEELLLALRRESLDGFQALFHVGTGKTSEPKGAGDVPATKTRTPGPSTRHQPPAAGVEVQASGPCGWAGCDGVMLPADDQDRCSRCATPEGAFNRGGPPGQHAEDVERSRRWLANQGRVAEQKDVSLAYLLGEIREEERERVGATLEEVAKLQAIIDAFRCGGCGAVRGTHGRPCIDGKG